MMTMTMIVMMATLMNMILGVTVMKKMIMVTMITIYIYQVRSLPKTFSLCMKSSCSVK